MDTTVCLNGLSVLLIEDDAECRDILKFFMSEMGIGTIIEKTNGQEALNFMDMNPHWRGLVLCDWNMPKMSGASFYRQVKNSHPDLPFIMVTGRNDEDSVHFAKDHGIFAYLLKPVSLDELGRKLRRVAEVHGFSSAKSVMTEHFHEDNSAYTI